MALTLARGILAGTFRQFRDCGQGRDECVVYWTGRRDTPGAVDDAVIPVHRAGPDWYETDPDGLPASSWNSAVTGGWCERRSTPTRDRLALRHRRPLPAGT